MNTLEQALLYGILDLGYAAEDQLEAVCEAMIDGGAGVIQLRAKGYAPEDALAFGRRVQPLCREAGVPFIINDHAQVAVEVGADGLHIGQDDGSLEDARSMIGPDMILGRSTHSPEQARQALEDGFDYIGFGPLFPTPTKQGRPGIGVTHVDEIQREVGEKIPMFCIGGIKRSNLTEVIGEGARRAVIVSDLLTADDIAAATRDVVSVLKGV